MLRVMQYSKRCINCLEMGLTRGTAARGVSVTAVLYPGDSVMLSVHSKAIMGCSKTSFYTRITHKWKVVLAAAAGQIKGAFLIARPRVGYYSDLQLSGFQSSSF